MPALAQNKELSDKSVLTLMQYAWGMMPQKFTTPDGKTITSTRPSASESIVPLEMAREVISRRRACRPTRSSCELPEEQRANYPDADASRGGQAKWTDQQMLFINQLHLFTVMTLTGKVQLVEKDGDKQVVVPGRQGRPRQRPAPTPSARRSGPDHGLREPAPPAAAAATTAEPAKASRHQPEEVALAA